MSSYEEFREITRKERQQLTDLSDFWNSKIGSDLILSEEIEGQIRAAVGKTRLLLAEKFKQFEGLIDQSENKTSKHEITMNDLQGFWDLVLLQVKEIKMLFQDLQNWADKRHIEFQNNVRKNQVPSNLEEKNASPSI